MLSSIKQDMQHGGWSKRFQIDRCKQHALGRGKKAISAKQDDGTRQSYKGRPEGKYSKVIRYRRKDGK